MTMPDSPVAIAAARGMAFAAAVLVAACGGSGSSPTAPTTPSSQGIFSLVVASVTPGVLPVGETGFASVSGWTTQNGSPVYGNIPVTRWTSANAAVATVANTGVVAAVGGGTATLTALFDGGSQATTVSVFTDRDIEGLAVSCPPIPVGIAGVFCTVAARTRYGNGPVKATWRSSRPEIASLANDGSTPSTATLLLGHATGQTVVTATYGAFQGSATVDVAR